MAAERERAGSTMVAKRLSRRDSLALERVVLDIRASLGSGGKSVIAKSFGKPGNISESERLGEGLDWKASSAQQSLRDFRQVYKLFIYFFPL